MDEKHPGAERIGRAADEDEREWLGDELLLAMGLVIGADLFNWTSSSRPLGPSFDAGLLRDA
jgi:hypothetical protein